MRKMILDMGLCLYGVLGAFQLKHADDDSPHYEKCYCIEYPKNGNRGYRRY